MITVNEVSALYARWAQSQVNCGALRPRTLDYYTSYHNKWKKYIGKKAVAAVIPLDLMMWGDTWHKVQTVQRLFNWAKKAGVIPANPVAEVPKPPRGERNRVLTFAEQLRAMRLTYRAFRAFLVAMRGSMARPQEIRELRWEDLRQLSSGEWYALKDDYKGRKRRRDKSAKRIIPISPRLIRLIERISRKRTELSGYIFLNSRGRPFTANAVRCAMRRLRIYAGLDVDQAGERVVCYTWRHSAATEATLRGLRDRVLAELMGHTSTRTTARYQHLGVEDLITTFAHSYTRGRPNAGKHHAGAGVCTGS